MLPYNVFISPGLACTRGLSTASACLLFRRCTFTWSLVGGAGLQRSLPVTQDCKAFHVPRLWKEVGNKSLRCKNALDVSLTLTSVWFSLLKHSSFVDVDGNVFLHLIPFCWHFLLLCLRLRVLDQLLLSEICSSRCTRPIVQKAVFSFLTLLS